MPSLGPIDFSGVKDFEPVAGEFEGQTSGWEAKLTKAGDSTNVEAKFTYRDDDGRKRVHLQRYNLKPEALWRIKRDLIAIGADPADFESDQVNLEAVLNDFFGVKPTPVKITFGIRDGERGTEYEGRQFQDLLKVEGAPDLEPPF